MAEDPSDPHEPVESYARGNRNWWDERPHPYRDDCPAICCADVRQRNNWPRRRTELERIAENARLRQLHRVPIAGRRLPDPEEAVCDGEAGAGSSEGPPA